MTAAAANETTNGIVSSPRKNSHSTSTGAMEPNLMELLELQTEDQLTEMNSRLDKSREALEELLQELENEREELVVEKSELDESIDNILQSANTLQISKENINATKLQETAMHKINRIASKALFRGKETVQINSHVGEFKRNPQAVDKRGNQVIAPGMFQSRFQMGIANANRWLTNAASEAKQGASAIWSSVGVVNNNAYSSSGSEKYSQPVVSRVSTSSIPASPSSQSNEDAAVLIEVELTLNDDRVLALQVRAADRACVAAEIFLQENKLNSKYKDALTKYLVKVEDEAERFPIHTRARLSDICGEAANGE